MFRVTLTSRILILQGTEDRDWALEYHTLILFSLTLMKNVYTFFALVT